MPVMAFLVLLLLLLLSLTSLLLFVFLLGRGGYEPNDTAAGAEGRRRPLPPLQQQLPLLKQWRVKDERQRPTKDEDE